MNNGQTPGVSRRQVLAGAGAAAGAAVAAGLVDGAEAASKGSGVKVPQGPARLQDIEHVVIIMQENRSFDHYFGTMRGVRGFDDKTVKRQANGRSVFYQPDVDLAQNRSLKPYLLPWRLNTKTTKGQHEGDMGHLWPQQQLYWNQGLMDGFVTINRATTTAVNAQSGDLDTGAATMGYFTREDIPWHYALADGYTIADNYFCSVIGPTNPNRIMLMSGTVDPDNKYGGGPAIDNSQGNGTLLWESYPERLQKAGISWKQYQERNNYSDNMLVHFAGIMKDPKSELYRRANSFIPTPKGQPAGPALIEQLRKDVVSGNLPQVSWVISSEENSEHPAWAPAYGAHFVDGCIKAIQADPKVWAKTVIFVNYDENDGFFDHVVPPTPEPGTPGEWVSIATALANPTASFGIAGPVGLGYRVPMTIVSPFSRGGLVTSDIYDHTSTLLFLEKRFGVEATNISKWRRSTVGDLTNAFNFAAGWDMTIPKLPDTAALVKACDQQASLPWPKSPAVQEMPRQEPGTRRHPSGPVPVRGR